MRKRQIKTPRRPLARELRINKIPRHPILPGRNVDSELSGKFLLMVFMKIL
jgi:hypothetical protein